MTQPFVPIRPIDAIMLRMLIQEKCAKVNNYKIDPLGLPTVPWLLVIIILRVPTFQNIAKQNKHRVKVKIDIGGTVGLAEGIIDDTYLLLIAIAICFECNVCFQKSPRHKRSSFQKSTTVVIIWPTTFPLNHRDIHLIQVIH